MNEKEKKLWLELYEVAEKIKDIEPWQGLYDTDILTYKSKKFNKLMYYSVMGNAGLHRAVAVYTEDQINKFFDLAMNKYPDYMLVNYQDCIICDFISREETLPENRKIIKELGLKFRGTWISFENFEKGYEPSAINIEQVEFMIEALQNFYMMILAMQKGAHADFEKGETLFRKYDEDHKMFLNFNTALAMPDVEFRKIKVKGEFEEYIKNFPKKDIELEYEFLNYLPIRIRENKAKDGRYMYPRARMLVDRKTGIPLESELEEMTKYKDEEEYILNSIYDLINIFEKMKARPKTLYIRDDETKACLSDMAKKADIELVVKPRLKAIDRVYESFFNI